MELTAQIPRGLAATLAVMDRLGRWPVPAVLAWLACWVVFRSAQSLGGELPLALGLACAVGVAASRWGATWWRRALIAGGFPLSFALSMPGLADLPAWGWLVPLALLLLVYPLNAWRDAPLFPTARNALADAPQHAPLAAGARVLDAGCGLGHGLQALRLAYPQAQLQGLEWSWLLRWVCALRCPWARVRQGDIWKADWSTYDMVYLFQRPESMERAAQKAARELRAGAWMVSLEFEATTLQSTATLCTPGGKMLWMYQAPFTSKNAPPGESP